MNKITYKCEYCGEEKTMYPSLYNKSKNHFCSRECFYNAKVKRTRGESKVTDAMDRQSLRDIRKHPEDHPLFWGMAFFDDVSVRAQYTRPVLLTGLGIE